MKQIFTILCAILVLSVILTGCVQEEQSSQEIIDDIEQETDELTQLEQELDEMDVDSFENDLDDIENW